MVCFRFFFFFEHILTRIANIRIKTTVMSAIIVIRYSLANPSVFSPL